MTPEEHAHACVKSAIPYLYAFRPQNVQALEEMILAAIRAALHDAELTVIQDRLRTWFLIQDYMDALCDPIIDPRSREIKDILIDLNIAIMDAEINDEAAEHAGTDTRTGA